MTPDAAGGQPPAVQPAADDAGRTGIPPASPSGDDRAPMDPGGTAPRPRVRPYLARSLPPPGPEPPVPHSRARGAGGLAVPRRRRSDHEPLPLPLAPVVGPSREIAPLDPPALPAARSGRSRTYGEELPEAAAVPRPFVLTAGRVAADVPYIGLETQVTARAGGTPPPDLAPQLTAIVALCAEPTSVAEISARLRMHLGVARILVADLHTAGLLDVPGVDAGMATDPDLIMRVMRGVRDLS